MKKFFCLLLSLLFSLSLMPLNALAEQPMALTPAYVRTIYLNKEAPNVNNEFLNKDIPQLKNDVLNQERRNRDEELLTRQLAQENAILVGKLQELQKQAGSSRGKSAGIAASLETLNQLKEVMENYSIQLDERNRQMMAHNEQTIALRARIEKLEALYNEVLSINSHVEDIKKQSTDSMDRQQEQLAAQFKDQKEFLEFKNKSLIEKYQQLLDFKAQLSRAQEELQSVKTHYQDLAAQDKGSVQTPQIVEKSSQLLNETLENLKAETVRLQQYQTDLKTKDETINQLQEQILKKDEQIAQLKSELVKSGQELQQSKNTIAAQQDAMNNLHQDLDQMKQTVGALKDKYTRYDEGFGLIRTKIIELKQKLADAQARNAQVDDQEEALNKLKENISDLTNQLKTGKEDLGLYKNQIAQLNASVSDLTAQLGAKNKDLQDKDAQIIQLRQQQQADQTTIQDLKSQMTDVTKQTVSLKTNVAESLRLKERAELYDVLLSKHELLEQLAVQKAALLVQLAQSSQDKSDYMISQLRKTLSFWQDLNKNDENQLEALKKDAVAQQDQIVDLQKQLEDGRKKTAQMESMLDVYQKKADDTETDAQHKTKEIDKLQGDLQTAQDSIDQREKDLKKVKDYFFEFEQRFTAKAKELRDKTTQLALLNATLDQKNQNLEELQTKLAALQDKLKGYQESGIQKNAENDKAVIEKQKQDLAALTERLTVAEEKLKTSADQQELAKTKQFVAAAGDEIAALKASLKDKNLQVEQFIKQTRDNEGLQKELDKTKAKISKLMEDLYLKDREIVRLKTQLSSRERSIKPVAEKLENMTKGKPEETSMRKNLLAAKSALAGAQKQIASLKEELKKKEAAQASMDDLKEQLKRAQKETGEARDAAGDKNKLAVQLSHQIKELNDRIQKLEKKIKSLKGDSNDV